MKKLKGISVHETSGHERVDMDSIRELIDNTADLLWSVDRDFKLVNSNRAFNDRKKEGRYALADDLELIAYYERTLKGEKFTTVEYTHDPVELWLEISFFPIVRDGDVTGVACHSRDITLMKTKEHRMELFESVVMNTVDSILITEASPLEEAGPKIVYVNDALTKMTGYSREEMLGKTSHILYGPNSDVVQIARSVKCLARSEACEIEIINYKKNGEEFWMHTSIAVIADGHGQSTHLISIGRDVTERVKNIEAIKQQNKKLTDIAWVQSHDVRGPLARIKGLVNLLSNHPHTEEDAELIGHLNFASNEMDAVVRRITTETEEIYGFVK